MQAWHVRRATAADRSLLERLAPRLTIGIPAWRDAELMRMTMLRFLLDDLANMGADSTVLIAEAGDGTAVGVATIGHSKHFTGQQQAELGELAVTDDVEGRGAGAALLAAAEAWAREHGFPYVALATGAANTRARRFYAHHGYSEEDIRLVKPL